ncbi:MAG: LysR substrate-binding domain-containing protein, partial [Pseudomonadota bacterium]
GLQEIREGIEEVRVQPESERPVTLLVSTSLASYWLMPRLARFKAQHTGFDLRCITMDSDRDIPVADFDLCIALGAAQWPGMQRWYFTDEALFPVCSPAYIKERGPIVDNRALLRHELLHLEERYYSRFDWGKWFVHFGFDARDTPQGWTSNDYSIVIQAALEGQGVAIGWRHIVQPLIENGSLVRPINESISTDNPFYIMAPRDREVATATRALRDWLVHEMGALPAK